MKQTGYELTQTLTYHSVHEAPLKPYSAPVELGTWHTSPTRAELPVPKQRGVQTPQELPTQSFEVGVHADNYITSASSVSLIKRKTLLHGRCGRK
jgi:hypothetical protein